MFTVIGIINGEEEKLTYEIENGCGVVSGDELAMFMFQLVMERKTPVGPVGQYMNRDINEPLAVLFMMKECFESIVSCDGDVPVASAIPDGAIG